ncbi:hypothetical protein AZ78_4927 [Lysobacter capsici AZ78]|uniref:Uncharacterized protein n=1 Tax=Lysobacter capsici AZ78 TaxID=1444315 RepID=A0A108U486_9GAMM|nr:hypothetical protein AZ78_4927 [Lysobacter capsici AZ78]
MVLATCRTSKPHAAGWRPELPVGAARAATANHPTTAQPSFAAKVTQRGRGLRRSYSAIRNHELRLLKRCWRRAVRASLTPPVGNPSSL